MKILLCFGTRPEAIKMAPIIHELEIQNLNFEICVTGQHREMLDQVLEFFKINPHYDIDVMQPEQSLNSLTSEILKELDRVLDRSRPALVLVQGDTTTAFVAAFAAFHRRVKVGHIEAGLRTHNMQSPFPEEANRQLISRVADYHFVPTTLNRENLIKEGIPAAKVHLTGNTVIDALSLANKKIEAGYENKEIFALQQLIQKDKSLLLVTGHRRENFGKGLEEICMGLLEIAGRGDVQIIFPVHLNPRVRKEVFRILGKHKAIDLIDPVSYPAFIWLMKEARIIISDSGGIQEEAPTLKKPVIVTRESTERKEAVAAGYSFLVGSSGKKLHAKVQDLLKNPPNYNNVSNPFGNGDAAKTIVEVLKRHDA